MNKQQALEKIRAIEMAGREIAPQLAGHTVGLRQYIKELYDLYLIAVSMLVFDAIENPAEIKVEPGAKSITYRSGTFMHEKREASLRIAQRLIDDEFDPARKISAATVNLPDGIDIIVLYF